METRFNGKVVPFASNASSGERTIFGDWGTESDDINDNLNADFLTGWEAGLEGVTNPYPPSQYFNAALYTATKLVAYLYQNGIAEWNATQEYKTNSIAVGSNGSIYRSTIDSNIGNNPTTDAVNWVNTFDSSNFVKRTDAQTIAGVKTFTSFPITPSSAPTTYYQVANKKYVDDNRGLGYNQIWQDLTANRSSGVTYTNTTGRPIEIRASFTYTATRTCELFVDGNLACDWESANTSPVGIYVGAIVPNGSTYIINAGAGVLKKWTELR